MDGEPKLSTRTRTLSGLSTYTTGPSPTDSLTYDLERSSTIKTIGVFKLRGLNDELPQSWWFASTAIPLLAATTGPFSNILSIAALVTPWRVTLPNGGILPEGADDNGIGIPDPRWEIGLNACSLACGFIGNIFLLLNFTGRVRYIIALPLSIIFWFLASGILIVIASCMVAYIPPVWPGEIYSQGFWYAVFAATMYVIGACMLMVNMLGYFLGHYPQHFDLDDSQRTLILQTMMFFFWMAGGAGIISSIEGWTYANSLYWANVSILTIGFGDILLKTNSGRGFLFAFELIGIIFLGLVISSITRFAANISADKIVKSHQKHARENTIGRTVTNDDELRERLGLPPRGSASSNTARSRQGSMEKYGQIKIVGRTVTFHEKKAPARGGGRGGAARDTRPLSRDEKMRARSSSNTASERRKRRRQKLLLLQEEKDRFDAMREIQDDTKRFKQYYALGLSFLAFGVLWCMGALVFWFSEANLQQLSYFDCLYFCWVSLLTIGYGDISPKSNIGKPFFVVWSLIAIPTMTVLVQEMSKTVVAAVNRGTFTLAEWTILPKKGVAKDFLESHPGVQTWLHQLHEKRKEKQRLKLGFQVQDPDTNGTSPEDTTRNLELLVKDIASEHDIARELAVAIQRVAQDIHSRTPVRYNYEQWVHFTKLIRFSRGNKEDVEAMEEDEGLVEWDWIGENSPMLADVSESQWVLDRLCESLNRYTRRQAAKTAKSRRNRRVSGAGEVNNPETIEETEEGESGSSSSTAMDAAAADDERDVKIWEDHIRSMTAATRDEDVNNNDKKQL